jgi:hypothetical protein
MLQVQSSSRTPSPERWQRAAERAQAEQITVRQLADSGAWVATSGRDTAVAYTLDVTGNIAHGCGCLAGSNEDPVCKHRAAFYLLVGALDVPPPARECLWCFGSGLTPNDALHQYDLCGPCGGTGSVIPTRAAAAIAA